MGRKKNRGARRAKRAPQINQQVLDAQFAQMNAALDADIAELSQSIERAHEHPVFRDAMARQIEALLARPRETRRATEADFSGANAPHNTEIIVRSEDDLLRVMTREPKE